MWIFQSAKRLVLSLVCVVILVGALFWLYLNIQASMQVSASKAQIQLSDSLPTKIQVGNYLETQSVGTLDTQLKIDQKINLPLTGKYLANLEFEVEVPVSVSVDYQTEVLIDENMPLETTTDLIYQNKLLPKFPLTLDIPIKLAVPFRLKQDYQVPIKIMFNGLVYLEFDEQVPLDVLHQFAPQLNLNDPMTMRKIANFNATMYNIERGTTANLEMNMTLPVKNIHP
ncbi:hypothetical protein [Acinetobacter johnsonii]|uniref:DUF2140 family protein n=1 Tax=Acinetobacter johnsonii TaxID=40214 RepID=A0AAV3WAW1_ACIJO|nr:hypothetical protein [Acinetobacter johnsonii]WQE00302.1 hypothetical protein U0040_10120 [Acinetobacter johnsonii]GEK43556.1 hypothetical protein AJO04nite_08140 [Acinetobacter johnsonii]